MYDDQPSANYPYKDVIGKPWNQQFGYIALGYFRTESEIQNSPKQIGNPRVGDLKYKDINGDGIVDTDDYVAIGRTAIPEINYGLVPILVIKILMSHSSFKVLAMLPDS